METCMEWKWKDGFKHGCRSHVSLPFHTSEAYPLAVQFALEVSSLSRLLENLREDLQVFTKYETADAIYRRWSKASTCSLDYPSPYPVQGEQLFSTVRIGVATFSRVSFTYLVRGAFWANVHANQYGTVLDRWRLRMENGLDEN